MIFLSCLTRYRFILNDGEKTRKIFNNLYCQGNTHYSTNDHNSSSSAKCPRCGDLGSLIEESQLRTLYQCRKCGIFSKPKPRRRLHGLRCACRFADPCGIARQELTKALEILKIAGHQDQDACRNADPVGIDALNLYQGKEGQGNV